MRLMSFNVGVKQQNMKRARPTVFLHRFGQHRNHPICRRAIPIRTENPRRAGLMPKTFSDASDIFL
jgi:hypothetical protein